MQKDDWNIFTLLNMSNTKEIEQERTYKIENFDSELGLVFEKLQVSSCCCNCGGGGGGRPTSGKGNDDCNYCSIRQFNIAPR